MNGAGSSLLPVAVVLPVSCLAVLVIAAHLVLIHSAEDMPLSRRRIRTAAGVVMIVTCTSLTYSFGVAPLDDIRQFTGAWAASVMLLCAVLSLASLDVVNNLRLARIHKRRMRRVANDLHRQIAQVIVEAKRGRETVHEPDVEHTLTLRRLADEPEQGE